MIRRAWHALTERAARRCLRICARRAPDFIIGGTLNPYLLRWYITPWRRWSDVPKEQRTPWQQVKATIARLLPNIYLHHFLRSDDDRALHDHPWAFNASWLIDGSYTEHTIAAGGIHHRRVRKAGAVRFRLGGAPHRVELHAGACRTLFFTGPVVREWGFHCPERGWVHWRDFTDPSTDGSTVGRGCDQ